MKIDLGADPAGDEFDPKDYDLDTRRKRTPSGQTLAKKFPHLEYASIPKINEPEKWKLQGWGEIENPFEVSLREMMDLWPETKIQQDFHCITGWSLFDTEWQGVPAAHIVDLVNPHDSVTTVLVHGLDEFSTCLWVEDFLQGILAYGYKGKPLSPAHGFPLRYIAPPHLWQYKSCKWVTGLEFLTKHKLGFWEIRAYSDSAQVWENDRYANPTAAKGKSIGAIRKAVLKQGSMEYGVDDATTTSKQTSGKP